jgi:hypothetical protein
MSSALQWKTVAVIQATWEFDSSYIIVSPVARSALLTTRRGERVSS